jgi:tRNA(fMet)-specific endonuclease VapC
MLSWIARLADIVAAFDSAAATFDGLRKRRVKIGSSDLKIASIGLAADALVFTANLRDFERVPDLKFENWIS